MAQGTDISAFSALLRFEQSTDSSRWWRRGVAGEAENNGHVLPTGRDWILAGILTVASVVEAMVDSDLSWPLVRLGAALVAVTVLPFRRLYPVLVVFVAFSVQFAVDLAAGFNDRTAEVLVGHLVAGLMLVYALCRWSVKLRLAVGIAVVASMVFVGEIAGGATAIDSLLFLILWSVLALFALAMRYRARLIASQHAEVRLAERNLLAREFHDTIAHHVSAIAVQAQMAQFIAPQDPARAMDAMKAVEDTANLAIDEMRHIVGALRSDDDRARTVAVSDLENLARPDGRPRVSIVGITDLTAMASPVAAAIYRITQESITNACIHSRGATLITATVKIRGDRVMLEIVNNGTPTTRNAGSGYGLLGMSERASALGGSLESGPRPGPESGWRVAAMLPLGRAS